MPVHPTKFGVHLYEPIIAKSFIVALLGDRISVILEILVSEVLI
jgi:hypothetical protein